MSTKTVGIFAIQGGYQAHQKKLEELGATVRLITSANQFVGIDALILPGGESTTLLKFFEKEPELLVALKEAVRQVPTMGTCAGALLLAEKVTGPSQYSLGLVAVTLQRNAYGRQLASHFAYGDSTLSPEPIPMMFIRAPKIVEIHSDSVKIIAQSDGFPVFVQQGDYLLLTYHPELTDDLTIHRYFLSIGKK